MIAEFFKGKSAIVTGAGKGMGRAISIKLDELGTKVYAVSNDPEHLKTLQAQCPNVTTITVDLSDWNATRAALEPLPTVDLLVNNAGICTVAKFMDTQQEDMDLMYKILFRAAVNVSQVYSKKLIAAGRRGSIVNMSSFASKKVNTLTTGYCAMKAALDNLTISMAIELVPQNIRVNAVNPGSVQTPLYDQVVGDMKSKMTPETRKEVEAATDKMIDINHIINTVLFLLSDAAESITGNITLVDGARSIS